MRETYTTDWRDENVVASEEDQERGSISCSRVSISSQSRVEGGQLLRSFHGTIASEMSPQKS